MSDLAPGSQAAPGKSQAAPGRMNNAFDPEATAALPPETRTLIDRRVKALGPAYRLFYEEPVQLVRGEGCRLWDADGREYLDAYNNVACVGHANPRVVEAVHRQMQTLATHTRYLSEGIVDYAEQLLATLSGPVADGHVMFTCTGSEANDLALRIARYATGNQGVIVTAEAYHGTTRSVAELSPSLGENLPLGTWVRTVPAPDTYRIAADRLPEWFADRVSEQIHDLQRHGQGVAALLLDTSFSSDGIFPGPPGLLAPALRRVRAAGGVFIADEVQAGFARLGERMWGYQRHTGADPEIVTFGKPMGNGYPVAGLAARGPVLEAFGRDIRYFNTFGGNTVAIAAAQATLDVIQQEGILDNSRSVGNELRRLLAELAQDHDLLTDVRGSGLYAGVEIGDGDADPGHAQRMTSAIVNGMRQRRVLISATGPGGNVLKIRPPLVFTAADAARLTDALHETLIELQQKAGQP